MKEDNYGIIIHPKDFDDLLGMSDEECGQITKNLVNTFLGKEIRSLDDRYLIRVSKEMCDRVLWDKGRTDQQRENGSKGGAPKGNQNARKTTEKQPKNNPKTTEEQAKTNLNSNSNSNSNYYKRKNQFTDIVTRDVDFEKLEKQLIKN